MYNLWITSGEMSGLYCEPQIQGQELRSVRKDNSKNVMIKKVFEFIS
jgi:hypothetical protein